MGPVFVESVLAVGGWGSYLKQCKGGRVMVETDHRERLDSDQGLRELAMYTR